MQYDRLASSAPGPVTSTINLMGSAAERRSIARASVTLGAR
jgi:hypothetical protein